MDAYVLEAHGVEAGVIVKISNNLFRFFAAIESVANLEGAEFATYADALRAAQRAIAPGRKERWA